MNNIKTPWGPVGYIVFKRTYSRKIKDSDINSPTEELVGSVDRMMEAFKKQLNIGFTEQEESRVKEILLSLKGMVAGRFLWQLGTKTVDRLGLLSLQNCAGVVVNEPIRPFTWTMDALMLGSGVGYNIQREYVYELPKPKKVKIVRQDTNDADFIVPDSREGWIELLRRVLEASFITGKGFSYSTVCVRGKGTPIKGFGGVSSGPEELCWGMAEINKVLNSRANKKIRPIDALDIMNIIGMIVVAGNVRRCLPEGSLVHTKRGLIKIEDILPGVDKALTSEGYFNITNKFKQGKQKLVKITTQDGSFECTTSHKMAIMKKNGYEWASASDLKPGDRLISSRVAVEGVETSLPEWKFEKSKHSTTCKDIEIPTLDASMSWLLGIFQADGYAYPNYAENGYNAYVSLVFGDNELDIAEKAQKQLQRFGKDLNVTLKKRKNENSYIVHCQSKQLAWYFDKNVKQAKTTLRVPDFIMQANTEIKMSFIAGVADGDGCLTNRPVQVVSTVYPEFAKDLQNLLYSCGIESRFHENANSPSREGWQRTYNLNLITLRSQKMFSDASELVKKVKVNIKSQNANGVPTDWIEDGSIRRKYGLYQADQLNIDSYDAEYGERALLPVEIVGVTDVDGEMETWDIEVDTMHEFFCNGYLTHNSAQIAIGDMDDLQFLNAKRWDLGNIPNWRAMSNNSVVCNDIKMLPEQFWQGYLGNGEAYGLINLSLSQKIGRVGETQYPDPNVEVYNPSLRAGTKIWTGSGIFPIESLQDKSFNVINLNGDKAEAKCWLSGHNKRLYKITLKNNVEYYCTPEHKWPIYTSKGWVKCETTDLKPGHLLPIVQRKSLEYGSTGNYSDGFFVGWLYGDGWITHRSDDNKTQYGFIVSKKDVESNIHIKIADKLEEITGNKHIGSLNHSNIEFNSANIKLHDYMLSYGVSHKKNGLPTKIWNECSEEFRRGFVDAIISSDGSIDSSYKGAKIVLTQSNKKLIDDIGELLGFYGIKCNFSYFKVKNQTFPNGKNYNKEYDRHMLQITTRQSIEHFRNVFNLTSAHKQNKLNKISKDATRPLYGRTAEIKYVELTDIYEDVWDISVFDDTHCFQLSHVITGNCGEQSLNNYETCCLSEVFLPNIATKEELKEVVTYLYRINKHSLSLPCHLPETEEVVHKNMRMGIGITGYLQSSEEQKSWLSDTYEYLRQFDVEYSKKNNWPTSVKLTTVKPSGTMSLLAGVTPGIHPAYSRFHIRRIRMASNSSLVETCRKNGYHVEFQRNFDGSEDRNTVVVSFPVAFPENTVVAKDMTAIDQLNTIKDLQTKWSDNSVSCTVYYKKEELDSIKEWLLKNYNENTKTVSFLLHSDHGFDQAPLEEITEEQYHEMVKNIKPITGDSFNGDTGLLDSFECEGGACPIK